MAHNSTPDARQHGEHCAFCPRPAVAHINAKPVCRSHISRASQQGSIYRIPYVNVTPRTALELLSGGAATIGKN